MKKIPGNLLKNLEKSWKNHGILPVQKSGNPEVNDVFTIIFSLSWLHSLLAYKFLIDLSIYAKKLLKQRHRERRRQAQEEVVAQQRAGTDWEWRLDNESP